MRKFLKVALPLLLVPAALIGGSTAAHASINTDCDTAGGAQACGVQETMDSGYCSAYINQATPGSSFAYLSAVDLVGTGYDCRFWLERDVNGTGWYDESGQTTLSPGNTFFSGNYWDGSGYQARACFEFLWSGTSDPGAVHCSGAIGDL